jgi:hypothetical protein
VFRNTVYGARLTARPKLVEPVNLVGVQCPSYAVGSMYRVLNRRRGQVLEETPRHPGTFFTIKAYLPVAESQRLTIELRASTPGQASPQCSFDHWSAVPGDPLDAGNECSQLVRTITTRRGLKASVPLVSVFWDRLERVSAERCSVIERTSELMRWSVQLRVCGKRNIPSVRLSACPQLTKPKTCQFGKSLAQLKPIRQTSVSFDAIPPRQYRLRSEYIIVHFLTAATSNAAVTTAQSKLNQQMATLV